jgi:hypothetical protein
LGAAACAPQAAVMVGADQRVDPEPGGAIELFEWPSHVPKLATADEQAVVGAWRDRYSVRTRVPRRRSLTLW